jgi:uncharacterized protein with GYD domain
VFLIGETVGRRLRLRQLPDSQREATIGEAQAHGHLITQASFTPESSKDTTGAPEDRVEAARRLIAEAGGTLIAHYLTSGDYDALLIFQAPSYEDAAPALAAAAARRGVADVKTVLVTSGGILQDAVQARPAVADNRPGGADMAALPTTESKTNVVIVTTRRLSAFPELGVQVRAVHDAARVSSNATFGSGGNLGDGDVAMTWNQPAASSPVPLLAKIIYRLRDIAPLTG